MQDRDVTASVVMKASRLEPAKQMLSTVENFPGVAKHFVNEVRRLMLTEDPSPEDGAELAQLVLAFEEDINFVGNVTVLLAELVRSAVISDPDGRGRLQ